MHNFFVILYIFLNLVSSLDASRTCNPDDAKCPFNDLSLDEMSVVLEIIQKSNLFEPNLIRISIIRAKEPRKTDWNAGTANSFRVAYVALWDFKNSVLSEVEVDLVDHKVLSKVNLPAHLPPLAQWEIEQASELYLNDSRVLAAYERRGLNGSYAWFEIWTLGATGNRSARGRLARAVAYYKHPDTRYYDWQPVEGIQATFDLDSMTLTDFLDTDLTPAPPLTKIRNQEANFVETPCHSTDNIKVNGQQISWAGWQFMYSMDPVQGLQFYHVRFHSDGVDRQVLYKMSVGEMSVPYGASGEEWRWRSSLDAGEYGLGVLAAPLQKSRDVPPDAILLNCTLYNTTLDDELNSRIMPGCIGVYERDSGLLYYHKDFTNGAHNSKRGSQLVVGFLSVIGNYDYLFEYIFNPDGVIEINVRLTGIVLTRGVAQAQNDPNCLESCATFVHNYLVAPPHQHFFNYRLDFDIDGESNHVMQVDLVNDPVSEKNLDGGAFSVRKKILKEESHDDYNVQASRSWQVVNSRSRNKFQSPRGYAVKPGDLTYSHLHAGNPYLPQMGFVEHAFWTTRYKDEEQASAGKFPRSGIPAQGLPSYVTGESIEDKDLVAWYTFGLTHVPRSEEWPLMNVHTGGFSLVPVNFLSSNPQVPAESE